VAIRFPIDFRDLGPIKNRALAQALPAYDRSGPVEVGWRYDDLPAQALMVSLLMIVSEVLADCGALMALTEKDELAEALALDGTDEALGVSVEVGTARRQADGCDPGRGERWPTMVLAPAKDGSLCIVQL
jgi:hypothetical protein